VRCSIIKIYFNLMLAGVSQCVPKCGHTFCHPCILKIEKNEENETPCPLCRVDMGNPVTNTQVIYLTYPSYP
jgi:hypothetical protein